MDRLRDFLARPLRDQSPLVLAGMLALLVAAAGVVLVAPSPRPPTDAPRHTTALDPPPASVLEAPHQRTGTTRPGLSAFEVARARVAARGFLASYLPVLYGRRPPSAIRDATAHVRRGLAGARRPAQGLRRRRPRVTALQLTSQSARSVLASATVRDETAARYRLIFTLELRRGRWLVSDLAAD